jgi:hypothetical protein
MVIVPGVLVAAFTGVRVAAAFADRGGITTAALAAAIIAAISTATAVTMAATAAATATVIARPLIEGALVDPSVTAVRPCDCLSGHHAVVLSVHL